MNDLEYILGIGFSGDDISRAIILAFFFAMFARRDSNVWAFGLFALLVDRIFWPLTAMSASGADFESVFASFGAMFETFTDDLGLYFVRYMGIVLMILAFIWVRSALQRLLPSRPAHA